MNLQIALYPSTFKLLKLGDLWSIFELYIQIGVIFCYDSHKLLTLEIYLALT